MKNAKVAVCHTDDPNEYQVVHKCPHCRDITCFDLGEHSYTQPCYKKIKETFGDRINLIVGDSNITIPKYNKIYDFIHIDGGHSSDVANIDILNCLLLSKPKTIIIMDDYNFPNLKLIWNKYVKTFHLKALVTILYHCPYHDIRYV